MNHKLRVLVRVDADPGLVTLEITGCLTPIDFPSLLHIMRRAGRLGAGADVLIDLHGTPTWTPKSSCSSSIADGRALAAGSGAGHRRGLLPAFRLTLDEPADLPICLLHVGAEAEVLAGLERNPLGRAVLTIGLDSGQREQLDSSPTRPCMPIPAELSTINGLELSEYFEETLDPARHRPRPVRHRPGRLADALYRHLDTSSPSSARTPGMSWPPKSCRTATSVDAAVPRRMSCRRPALA